MKMPEKIENVMFAPCGMNCAVCYKHLQTKKNGKPCAGCLLGDLGKPQHCRKCKIKACVRGKGVTYCYECLDFPCKQIKSLEKSYNKRYGESLVNNSMMVKDPGIDRFMDSEKVKWTCSECGGIISLHDLFFVVIVGKRSSDNLNFIPRNV